MISNLLNNSFEAIEGNKGCIQLTLRRENGQIKIIIEDDGNGMPPEITDKIMNNIIVTAGKSNGCGIGYTQVRENLKASNGQILIESTIAKGTKVILSFPIVDPPNWIAQQISLPKGAVVVVIDDDPSIH